MHTPPALVNLTDRTVYVVADGKLLELPKAPAPRAMDMSARTPARTLAVSVGDEEVALDEIDTVCNLVSGPPVIDGVLWLVKAPILAQFVDREDFVRPALYKLYQTEELDCTSVDEATLRDREMLPGSVMVLTAVTKSPIVVSPDAVRMQDLDAETQAGPDDLGD